MFALIIYEKVLVFDVMKHYGLYNLADTYFLGYRKILDFKTILKYYEENFFDNNLIKIERYLDFLFKICILYLKDFHYI